MGLEKYYWGQGPCHTHHSIPMAKQYLTLKRVFTKNCSLNDNHKDTLDWNQLMKARIYLFLL